MTCGRPREEGERFSWSGQCPTCGEARLTENIAGLRNRDSNVLLRWRRGMAASVGGVLREDVREDA